MKFGGMQKLTLLDYPEKVSCTLFTYGCNFRCPFCHNASLVIKNNEQHLLKEKEILAFLQSRQGLLDGVCLSGGEPLLQEDIESFIKQVKDMGYLVKLDTNGSMPDKLKKLVQEKLVDYVAMDVKNSLPKYGLTVGIDDYDTKSVQESAYFLLNGEIDYEFRTTVVKELHEPEDFLAISQWLKGVKRYFLQTFEDSGDTIGSGLHAHTQESMQLFKELLSTNIKMPKIRNK